MISSEVGVASHLSPDLLVIKALMSCISTSIDKGGYQSIGIRYICYLHDCSFEHFLLWEEVSIQRDHSERERQVGERSDLQLILEIDFHRVKMSDT